MKHFMAGLDRSRTYHALVQVLWYCLLITIPVTSSPWVAALTGRSEVSPLAGIPLFFFILIWLLPYLFSRGRLPATLLPLLAFLGLAVGSSVAAGFLGIFPLSVYSPVARELRALLTLLIGILFYVSAAVYPQSEKRLRSSLRWLYLGAAIMMFWSSVQIYFLFRNIAMNVNKFYMDVEWVNQVHRIFSVRSLFTRRVTGLAFEPSWLADQLVILYLPLLIASFVKRFSVFTEKPTRISVESGLLLWGIVILFFSQSRIGYLSFSAIVLVLAVKGMWSLAGTLSLRFPFVQRMPVESSPSLRGQPWWRWLIWLTLLAITASILGVIPLIASQVDVRVEELLDIEYRNVLKYYDEPVFALADKLYSAERLVYWTSGFRVFSMYPFFGVGLGNAGFFFLDTLPSYGTRLPEVIRILQESSPLPNPKSLWIRILAETGIAGFLLFVIWLLLQGLGARQLLNTGARLAPVVGLAGLLALIALFFEGFSLDTFALPQIWVMLGLVTAMWSTIRVESHSMEVK